MVPPTDAQWSALSKCVQSIIQRADAGTYTHDNQMEICFLLYSLVVERVVPRNKWSSSSTKDGMTCNPMKCNQMMCAFQVSYMRVFVVLFVFLF